MKKTIATLLIFVSVLCLFGCKKDKITDKNINQIRFDIFCGAVEDFNAVAYSELKKSEEGNNYAKIVVIRIEELKANGGAYNISFNYGEKNYSKEVETNPLTNTLSATVYVESFPENEFIITVQSGESTYSVTMKSVLTNSIISYETAFKTAKAELQSIEDAYISAAESYVYNIRLLYESEKLYWYVGLVGSTAHNAVLIDAESGVILAKQEFKN